ncbi:TonB-dependent receptor [Sphingomonas sp. HF-S4]|uniref:TonB-dependent receptor n=1 Tax=Sphingomonas agrestis TaxID=3080540 RepID=A0ABU3Y3B3_9SPHN|nr:TonB-dependent receptor [Sphingomonas sp. HF-S4]MDV3455890.1 TonB-dependent receptor [Sphingomonas sp. HF-S4]
MRGETQLRRGSAIRKTMFAGGAALWCLAAATPGMAQTAPAADAEVDDQTVENDAIVVTGVRATIETSNAVKREENAIVDALSSTEIGDLPALSIGEAIQTITGATSHQEKGGATEISLRGLGSFLSATTFNGREASNGSGDRAVNFNQFPSELVNDIKIHKSQQANLVEGGVSGTIELGTLRPLDYGKRSIQVEAKANYNPYQDKITGEGAWGWRGTISYVDQFKLGSLGDFGIALGFQRNEVNNPEETYAASSTWVACNPTINAAGNCTEVTRAQGNAGTPFVLVPNSITFRQITEQDKRDAFMGSVQWQPNDRIDVNLDLQYSNRDYREDRHDLNLSETRYQLRNIVYDDQHRLISMSGLTSIEANGTVLDRNEEYLGGGGNISWKASDRLTLSSDVSYSQTKRNTLQRSTRLRTDPFDIDNVRTPLNNQRISYTYDASGGYAAVIALDPRFDVNNWALYSDDARLRRDLEYKQDKIFAARLDASYEVDGGFLKRFDIGGRYSHRRYENINDLVEITQDVRTVDRDVNRACRRAFPQTGYLEDAPAQSIAQWATFDTLCQFEGYLGTLDPGANEDLRAVDNADVTEKVWAGYAMASYQSSIGNLPIRGNFGVRAVQTDVRSIGLRSGLDVISNSDGSVRLVENGDFDTQVLTNSYFRVLPSVNANFELTSTLIARVAGYRGMSRPAPSDLAAGRTVALDDGTAFSSISDAIREIVADGSPGLKPIMSWNGDISLEWYPNRDTIVAGTFFYKRFGGGFVPVRIDEQFAIDGQDVTVPVTQRQNSNEQSRVLGFDVTLSNRFSWLPKPLDGFGAKVSYSYADVGFKNYDIRLGDVFDPDTGTIAPGVIPPAGLSGSSKHVASAQLYYQNGPVMLSGIYTYRSSYYQDFVGGNTQLRFVRPSDLVNLRASYNLNRNVSLRFEALNVFNNPKVTDMPVYGSSRQYHYYGAKYFIGARVRL